MRRCFYHTDLGQNAVFHNFAIQKNALAKPLKNFQNHLYGEPVLTFDKRQSRLFKLRLTQLYAST